MQVLGRVSAKYFDFALEKSKNHRDAIPNNEHTERKRHMNMPRINAMSRIISGGGMGADDSTPLDEGLTDVSFSERLVNGYCAFSSIEIMARRKA